MSSLAKFTKQPADVQDYNVSYVDWLANLSDTGSTATVSAPTGITIVSYSLLNGIVKVWVSGGTNNVTYTITVVLTTAGGRTKEADFAVKVKQVS